MTAKNKVILNSISILFVVLGIFLLLVSDETKTKIIAIICLIFFGGGNIAHNILLSNTSGSLAKNIAGMSGCLIFIIACFFILPFNHLFDNSWRYNPTIAWIIGIAGILFFFFGFLKFTINLLKRNYKE